MNVHIVCVCGKLHLLATNMESPNISDWTIYSELMHQLSNYSADLVNNTEPLRFCVAIPQLSALIMCTLGLPGNMFIFAVYVLQMKSSTRVYMFALAIADTAVCVSGIVLSMAFTDIVTNYIFTGTINVFTTFAMFILTFVSIERFLAIRRPHTFSLNLLRAQKSLGCITLLTGIFETLLRILDNTGNEGVVDILGEAVIMPCIAVIVTCYSLIAVSLLQKARASRVKIAVITVTDTNKATTSQAKNIRGVRLLFVITVVFVCSWLPQWLSNAGVYIPSHLRRLYLVNSVVNPYI